MQERKRLEDIIKELPEDLRKELENFARFYVFFLILLISLPLFNYSIKF